MGALDVPSVDSGLDASVPPGTVLDWSSEDTFVDPEVVDSVPSSELTVVLALPGIGVRVSAGGAVEVVVVGGAMVVVVVVASDAFAANEITDTPRTDPPNATTPRPATAMLLLILMARPFTSSCSPTAEQPINFAMPRPRIHQKFGSEKHSVFTISVALGYKQRRDRRIVTHYSYECTQH
ncbi:MAG TPA: hypothetical protein VNE22_03400 [Acidimicrobiales bacterium]|nr:hypothetical protein [Acidimicrobiales bacterium]